MPTTLLAQVTSCIGGKQELLQVWKILWDLLSTKINNDTELLESLPREIICGYAEILKHSLIADKNFLIFFKNILKF